MGWLLSPSPDGACWLQVIVLLFFLFAGFVYMIKGIVDRQKKSRNCSTCKYLRYDYKIQDDYCDGYDMKVVSNVERECCLWKKY